MLFSLWDCFTEIQNPKDNYVFQKRKLVQFKMHTTLFFSRNLKSDGLYHSDKKKRFKKIKKWFYMD